MSVGTWIWLGLAGGSGATLALGRPWTAMISRRRYPAQVRAHPLFIEANCLITGLWTLYFAVAAGVTALTGFWIAVAFSVPTPALGWVSYAVGDRYARWKMTATV